MNSQLKSYIVKGKADKKDLERKRKLDQNVLHLDEDVAHPPSVKENIPIIETSSTPPLSEHVPKVQEEKIKHHIEFNEMSDSVLTSVVLMLNQILEELSTINQKIDSKAIVESVQPKRRIVLNRDKNGKIIGADVVDVNDGE